MTLWRRSSQGEELSDLDAGVSSPGLASPSWATLDMSLNLSGPQFPCS